MSKPRPWPRCAIDAARTGCLRGHAPRHHCGIRASVLTLEDVARLRGFDPRHHCGETKWGAKYIGWTPVSAGTPCGTTTAQTLRCSLRHLTSRFPGYAPRHHCSIKIRVTSALRAFRLRGYTRGTTAATDRGRGPVAVTPSPRVRPATAASSASCTRWRASSRLRRHHRGSPASSATAVRQSSVSVGTTRGTTAAPACRSLSRGCPPPPRARACGTTAASRTFLGSRSGASQLRRLPAALPRRHGGGQGRTGGRSVSAGTACGTTTASTRRSSSTRTGTRLRRRALRHHSGLTLLNSNVSLSRSRLQRHGLRHHCGGVAGTTANRAYRPSPQVRPAAPLRLAGLGVEEPGKILSMPSPQARSTGPACRRRPVSVSTPAAPLWRDDVVAEPVDGLRLCGFGPAALLRRRARPGRRE